MSVLTLKARIRTESAVTIPGTAVLMFRLLAPSSRLVLNSKPLICTRNVSIKSQQKGIYIWGRGDKGQLGLGERTKLQATPSKIDFGEKVKSFHAGWNHLVILTEKGEMYNFGENTHGQLGHGHTNHIWTPTKLGTPGKDTVVKKIACGAHHTLVAVESSEGPQVFSFGRNAEGQLGIGSEEAMVPVPTEIKAFRGKTITDMACGEDFSVVVSGKDLFTFGRGDMGQHGTDFWGGNRANAFEPKKLMGLTDRITQVQCGWAHTVGVAKRRVWSWGANGHGQCGCTDQTVSVAPLLLMAFPEEQPRVIQVACGATHSMVLCDSNNVYIVGSAADGKLGLPTEGDLALPRRLTMFDTNPIKTISCGADHSAVLTKDGTLWMWGFGQHGVLGFPDLETRSTPTPLLPPPGLKFTMIKCGMDFSVALAK